MCKRINIVKRDLIDWGNEELILYQNALSNCYDLKQDVVINVCSMRKERADCGAGLYEFALAPNGRFYICPAYYFENKDNYIGNLKTGIQIKEQELFTVSKAKKCMSCDISHCQRCSSLNKVVTKMVNVPADIQCKVAELESKLMRECERSIYF